MVILKTTQLNLLLDMFAFSKAADVLIVVDKYAIIIYAYDRFKRA